MWGMQSIVKQQLSQKSLFSIARFASVVTGRATSAATKDFIGKSALPMYHQLDRTSLYINPIIHGAPFSYDHKADKDYISTLAKHAIIENRSNCVLVYQQYLNDKIYYYEDLPNVIASGAIKRDELVTIANIGKATKKQEVLAILDEARKLTNLEFLDMAIFEVDDALLEKDPKIVNETMETLQEECVNNRLHSFGIKISVAPYIYHSPPMRTSGDMVHYPSAIETEIKTKWTKCELVIYPISPSIAFPTTYPLLPAVIVDDMSESTTSRASSKTQTLVRNFTRAASDPLLCRSADMIPITTATGPDDMTIPSSALAASKVHKKVSLSKPSSEINLLQHALSDKLQMIINETLNELCPALSSTPMIQQKALRIVFSIGVDVVIVDAETSAYLGKFSLTPRDLVNSDQTGTVFGSFCIPSSSS